MLHWQSPGGLLHCWGLGPALGRLMALGSRISMGIFKGPWVIKSNEQEKYSTAQKMSPPMLVESIKVGCLPQHILRG